jgi:hypothetical protein
MAYINNGIGRNIKINKKLTSSSFNVFDRNNQGIN